MDIITAIYFILFTLCFLFFFGILKTGEKKSQVLDNENQVILLPEDIISHIFSLLPVKSITRCGCVSKYWYNKLLKDPFFINMHLKRSTRFNCFSINSADEFYLHISKSSSLSSFEDDYYEEPVKMDSPYTSQVFQNPQIQCYDSCNGVILLRSFNRNTEEVICLWNPATREFKDIMVPKVDCYHSFDGPAYGFGYNYDIDDYVIVKANDVCDSNASFGNEICVGCVVQVYTLRSDTWITLPDMISYKIMSPKAAVSTNDGALLHWIAQQTPCPMNSSGRDEVVSFHVRDKIFRKVPLTAQVGELVRGKNNRSLAYLGGYLCVVQYGGYHVVVWAMKNYKAKESWTKLFIAQLPLERPLFYMKLILELKNGEVLFIAKTGCDDVYFVMYDSVHQKSKVAKMHHEIGAWTRVHTYVESLVALR